jgi:hypothetical protein
VYAPLSLSGFPFTQLFWSPNNECYELLEQLNKFLLVQRIVWRKIEEANSVEFNVLLHLALEMMNYLYFGISDGGMRMTHEGNLKETRQPYFNTID